MLTIELASQLCCPNCAGRPLEVAVTRDDGRRIFSGGLRCDICKSGFPINDGVPELVPPQILRADAWHAWNECLAALAARRQWCAEYSDHFLAQLTNRASLLQMAFAEFAQIGHGAVLDIGCGDGAFRRFLNARKVRYYGIDPLTLPETEHFRFVRGVAERLPFADCTFDHLVVFEALDQFHDLNAFCREATRVLTPGGRLHIAQHLTEFRGPLSLAKTYGRWVKEAIDARLTGRDRCSAPNRMARFSSRSIARLLRRHFDTIDTWKSSKCWHRPDNIFLTLVPRISTRGLDPRNAAVATAGNC